MNLHVVINSLTSLLFAIVLTVAVFTERTFAQWDPGGCATVYTDGADEGTQVTGWASVGVSWYGECEYWFGEAFAHVDISSPGGRWIDAWGPSNWGYSEAYTSLSVNPPEDWGDYSIAGDGDVQGCGGYCAVYSYSQISVTVYPPPIEPSISLSPAQTLTFVSWGTVTITATVNPAGFAPYVEWFGCNAGHTDTQCYVTPTDLGTYNVSARLGYIETYASINVAGWCGDARDTIISEYAYGGPGYPAVSPVPSCADFSDSGGSTHFTWAQYNGGFQQGSGHNPWGIVKSDLTGGMEEIYAGYAFPTNIYISSGYRCPHGNHASGGVTNSNHMKGHALDLFKAPEYRNWSLEQFNTLRDAALDTSSPPNEVLSYTQYTDHHLHIAWE